MEAWKENNAERKADGGYWAEKGLKLLGLTFPEIVREGAESLKKPVSTPCAPTSIGSGKDLQDNQPASRSGFLFFSPFLHKLLCLAV